MMSFQRAANQALPDDDEIVVTGMAGRFPNSANVAEFAYNLYNKINMVDEAETRWKHLDPEVPRQSGKMPNLEKFDSSFFSVHHRQANSIDPQCRLLLEHAYEAILDAGVNPKSLRGSRTAVYVGCATAETEEEAFFENDVKSGLGVTGFSRAMMANRVSFALSLNGPSFVIDSACSSAAYALDCAYKSIMLGECDAALIGGSNLLLHPKLTLQFSRLQVLSLNGQCRPFDNDAAGYLRSETVGMIFLQRKSQAKRMYATLVHSKSNNDGFKNEGITYPSGENQIKLLKGFYEDIKMDPSTIDYVEAHATGTRVGDPQESLALDVIFSKNRNGRPVPVGSVKSNMGHSEAASCIPSLAKILLTVETQLIPPNIHFEKARDDIPSLKERLQVVREVQPLAGPMVCMNSFGVGGANVHALFKGNLKEKVNHGIPADNLPRLVTWSGRTEEAVKVILDSVTKKQLDAEYVALLNNIQSATNSANTYRGYGIYTQNGNEENAKCIEQQVQHLEGAKRPLAFVYSGMGSQWCEMGADLMRIPIFAAAIEKCHDILMERGLNLKDILTSPDPKMYDNILHSFVGIAAIQIGLTDVLKALGLKPDYIVGHSVGELGCAYGDECFTVEETILGAYSRGIVSITTKTILGSMAAVGIGYQKLKTMVPEEIVIACHNSADSCTISGPADKVGAFVNELKKQKYFAKEVQCSNIAYHSKYIADFGPKLLRKLNEVIRLPKQRSSKWISSSVPVEKQDSIDARYSSAQYHVNNLSSPVLFEEAINKLPSDVLAIEIAPHGLLQAILKGSLRDSLNVSLTKRGNPENSVFAMKALGKIFQSGFDIDLNKLYPPVEFPVSRGTPMISSLIKWNHAEDFYVMKYEDNARKKVSKKFNINVQDEEYLLGHRIDGRAIYPATGYIYIVWQFVAYLNRIFLKDCEVVFEDVEFLRATHIDNQEVDFLVAIHKGTGRFEISEGENAVVTGFVRSASLPLTPIDEIAGDSAELNLQSKDFYKELRLRGYQYNGLFRSIVSSTFDGSAGKVQWSDNWVPFLDCLLQLQIVGQDTRSLILPTKIRKFIINPKEHHAMLDKLPENEKIFGVFANSSLNLIRCGGVEIIGVETSTVSRRRALGCPVLETYQFVPYLPTPKLNKVNMARFCIQLVLENVPMARVVIVEIDANDGKEPIIEHFGQALGDLPLVTEDLNYVTTRNVELENVKVENCSLTAFDKVNFIIRSEVLNDSSFLESVKDPMGAGEGGFVVSRESKNLSLSSLTMIPEGFQVIAMIPSDDETIVLLQHLKSKLPIASTVIEIASSKFEWLDQLQQAVRVGPVLAYSEKDDTSGIVGLVNCVRKEANGQNLKCVFIDDDSAPSFDATSDFYKRQLQQGLAINVLRNGKWGSYRHFLLQQEIVVDKRTDHCYANSLTRGDLSSITWLNGPLDTKKPAKALVRIQYASLNFRDVMLATGKLMAEVIAPGRLDQLCILGLEYSGVTSDNKRVMGVVPSGCLATHVEADEEITWNVPDHWTLEEAASVPAVYGTVYMSFFVSTQIQKGKSILIHAGSGGVGLAAIRVAFAYGLDVFTTVSTKEKKQFLLNEFPQLKEENIGNSRDTSFEKMIMKNTKGKGVDYVLNSLADEMLQASIRCLGLKGKFLEIGKFDMSKGTKISLSNFLKELSFHAVLLDRLIESTTDDKLSLRNLIEHDIKRGIIKPLKTTVFQADEIEQAFRYLASGKHVGKVMLKMRENENSIESVPISVTPRVYCSPHLSYIVPGGLGGFGLELADWLVLRGCRKLVLSSSRGISKSYQSYRIKTWESYGAQVVVSTSDISKKSGCERLIKESIKLGPVGGIFNLAVVLQDAIFENQDEGKFVTSFAPKAVATKYFDELSRKLCPELQYFVVFSSVSCGRGNAGQSNYGMSNSIMERIIEKRDNLGLPAKAIQWGAVGEVGLVADMLEDKLDMEIGGTLQQRISSCLDELDALLLVAEPLVASMVVAEKRYSSGGKRNILEAIMNIMTIRDIKSLSLETTLTELGMDSLMTVEIQQTLEREFDFNLSTHQLRSMTLMQLIKGAQNAETMEQSDELEQYIVAADVALFMKNFGDEKSSDKTIVQLESSSQNANGKVLIVPGVEGAVSDVWRKLAKHLNCPTFLLQTRKSYQSTDINFISDSVAADVIELFKNDSKFSIIGYSFGALLSLKIAKILESQGKTGNIVFVDGAPKFVKALNLKHFPGEITDDIIESAVLMNTIATTFPDNISENARQVFLKPSWETRSAKLMALSKDKKPYSDEFGIMMLNSLFNRLKLAGSIDLQDYSMLHKASITLIKPTKLSVPNLEEDYDLKCYSSNSVDVRTVEGNHATILENPALFEMLNKIIM